MISPELSASHLQISEQNYLTIEAGKDKITGDQIVLLADLYCRDFRYFVTGDYASAESQIKEMFRCNAKLSRSDRVAIQKFVRLCEYEDFLEREVFDNRYPSIPNYEGYHFDHSYFKKQGEEVAVLERKRLNLAKEPIENVFELLRSQGIHIFRRRLNDENISGLYINHPTAGHCILINYLDDIYRQNFSAAHEYCHALFDSSQGQDVTYIGTSGNELEWRANSFAGNFLVPKQGISKSYAPAESYEDWVVLIRKIADRFNVSSWVVIIRLAELNWIDRHLQEKLNSDKRLVIKRIEKTDPELPSNLSSGILGKLSQVVQQGLTWHYIGLCEEAYRRGEITYYKMLDMLMLPLEEGRQLLGELLVFLEVNS